MEMTTKAWVALEAPAFENFNEVLAIRTQESLYASIAETLRRGLDRNGSAAVTLPWGTYSADIKVKGESGNITPTWEPSKTFMKILNGDSDAVSSFDRHYQDEFDPDFVQLFTDHLAYGMFDPNSPENKDQAAKNKGLKLADDEVDYMLNSFAQMLCTVAKDKQRDGKVYSLEIDKHGRFDFEYSGDDTKVKFIPNKSFKQALKNDSAVVED